MKTKVEKNHHFNKFQRIYTILFADIVCINKKVFEPTRGLDEGFSLLCFNFWRNVTSTTQRNPVPNILAFNLHFSRIFFTSFSSFENFPRLFIFMCFITAYINAEYIKTCTLIIYTNERGTSLMTFVFWWLILLQLRFHFSSINAG